MFQCDFSWPRHQMVIFAVVVHLMISSILVTFHIMFHSCPHGCTSPPFNRWLIIIMSSWLIGFLCCWVDFLNSVQSAFLLLHSLLLYLLHLSTLLFNHPNDGHIFNQQTQSEKVVLIDPWQLSYHQFSQTYLHYCVILQMPPSCNPGNLRLARTDRLTESDSAALQGVALRWRGEIWSDLNIGAKLQRFSY